MPDIFFFVASVNHLVPEDEPVPNASSRHLRDVLAAADTRFEDERVTSRTPSLLLMTDGGPGIDTLVDEDNVDPLGHLDADSLLEVFNHRPLLLLALRHGVP